MLGGIMFGVVKGTAWQLVGVTCFISYLLTVTHREATPTQRGASATPVQFKRPTVSGGDTRGETPIHTFVYAPGASPPRLVDVRPAAARELPLPPIFFPRLLPSDVARPRLALGRRSDLRTVSTVSIASIVSV